MDTYVITFLFIIFTSNKDQKILYNQVNQFITRGIQNAEFAAQSRWVYMKVTAKSLENIHSRLEKHTLLFYV